VALLLALFALPGRGEDLTPDRLGVIYSLRDSASERIARFYAAARHVPTDNLIGLDVPDEAVISRETLRTLRVALLARLPSGVQSLLLVWSRPYAVECMSVTTAFAAGYQPGFCEPGCRRTRLSPLFDSQGWLPADTVGWLPAMLLPTRDEGLARAVIERGIEADSTLPRGIIYLIRTSDGARNVRAAGYGEVESLFGRRMQILEENAPIHVQLPDAIAYFTGVERVAELHQITFRPGAVADHLTSTGGVLEGGRQMSALEWLQQGATGSYGSVSEPCSHLGKFPSPVIFLDRYLRGETLLESYWKSVAMPGQGLFIGEPLARPFREVTGN
jgi:uncharacterized protein (TIGR03790 family)